MRASLKEETDENVVVRFSVCDTGIGIPHDKQEVLFQQFTQVDASTTRIYGGTGLGLAISRQLSEMMGGEIGVISHVGQGSEFWFTANFRKSSKKQPTLSPIENLHDVRILIVDDNATNREILMVQFKAWGALSDEAPEAVTGLRMLREAAIAKKPYRVAVLDLQMPDMDGVEIGKIIKTDATLSKTSLMMMTSLGERGDAQLYKEIGFSAYLTKPVRHSELFEALKVILTGKSCKSERTIVTQHSLQDMRPDKVSLLLVEDNIVNQKVALALLRKLGLSADVAANGIEAVKALELTSYDLVLMDVQMPEMDGYEATRQIRDPESKVCNHNVPIIAMTANAMLGDREACLDAGMNDYLAKPVKPQVLAEMLDKWLPAEIKSATRTSKSEAGTEQKMAANKENSLPVFDNEVILEHLMGDHELAQTNIAGFLEDIPQQIQTLKKALAATDITHAERQAHTIKGASANVGGMILSELARTMEKSVSLGDLCAAKAKLPELESQFERLQEAMQAIYG